MGAKSAPEHSLSCGLIPQRQALPGLCRSGHCTPKANTHVTRELQPFRPLAGTFLLREVQESITSLSASTPSVLQDFHPHNERLRGTQHFLLPCRSIFRSFTCWFTADVVPVQMGQQSNKCGVVIKTVQCTSYPMLCDRLPSN